MRNGELYFMARYVSQAHGQIFIYPQRALGGVYLQFFDRHDVFAHCFREWGRFFLLNLGTIWLKKDIWLSSSYKNAKKITMKGRNFRIMGANIWVRVICTVFFTHRGVIGV